MAWTCPFGLECPGELTCPECGSTMALPAGKQVDGLAGHRIVIVRRPPGWVPQSETDAPPRCLVLELVDGTSVGDPLTFVRQYNAASIEDDGSRWAALTHADARIGQTLDLLRRWAGLPP